jgi:hypothetical protein
MTSPLLRRDTPLLVRLAKSADGTGCYCIAVVVARLRRNLLMGDDYDANRGNQNLNWYNRTGLFGPG